MDQAFHVLGDYIDLLRHEGVLSAPVPAELNLQATVQLVSYDSRQVVPGTLFVCKGAHFKPEFLMAAKAQGALAYLSAVPYPQVDLPCLLTGDLRRAIALLADLYYNHPSGELSVVGITGTKGKSSTAYYIKYILDEYLRGQSKAKSAIISSIDTYDGVERFESHLTTPEPLELQRHFKNAIGAGIGHVTMEVSSQALKYHRTLCTQFSVACFLNIGHDHISPIEHSDFEDYFASKLKIFAQAQVCCVNLDCDHAPRIVQAARATGKLVYTFSQRDEHADVFASDIQKQGNDTLFQVKTRAFTRQFRLTMPGLFNVENALAAIAVCQSMNIPQQYIYRGLVKARVPGRMEVYSSADETVTAIVDYAHNRMSFETLFRSARTEYPWRRMVAIFGCPGNKALDRRRDLGEVSGQYADMVVLTEEDSGEEDTQTICLEIARHVVAQGCRCTIEPNRGEAIRQAILGCAGRPTVLLITGKGAETRQKRGTEYIETVSDVDYVQAFLQEYDIGRGRDRLQQVRGLLTILPALKRARGQTVVIKYDACASTDRDTVMHDVAALGQMGVRVVLIYVGGGQTDPADAAGATEWRCGVPVGTLTGLGARAVALSGGGHSLLRAVPEPAGAGTVIQADPWVVTTLLDGGFLPVLPCVARGADGGVLPCDANDAAQAVAQALKADRLLLLTQVEGGDTEGKPLDTAVSQMDLPRAEELLRAGLPTQELAAMVDCCAQALRAGVVRASVLNGHTEHVLLLEMLEQQLPVNP